ncbi:hypothetical protein IT418_02385 [bacterium]|nr:hypothetical protein [bacterium]
MRPYFLQPYKLLPYIGKTKQIWPKEITREYYVSFEDALWDLLPRLGYRKGMKFLVPSFYCVDVIKNIKNHGYEVAIYNLDKKLEVDREYLLKRIEEENPDIFINFDAVGVPTGLSEWLQKKLPFQKLIIEDKVHTLVGSSITNYPISDRHLILTSSRKVSPFQGSLALYTRNARRSQNKVPIRYTLQVFAIWIYYLALLHVSALVHSRKIARCAAKMLAKHNDLIGDEKVSAPLPNFFLHIIDTIPVAWIEKIKTEEYRIYEELLSPLFGDTIWTMPAAAKHSNTLRGYPVIMESRYAQKFISECQKQGFFTISELDDCQWAEKQKIFYLPLGPHLSFRDIQNIAQITQKALTTAIHYDIITA